MPLYWVYLGQQKKGEIMDIDKLISESINALADDNPSTGVECLVELANAFAVTGMSEYSFLNLRKYIIQEALKLPQCPILIETKIKQAEKLHRNSRYDRK